MADFITHYSAANVMRIRRSRNKTSAVKSQNTVKPNPLCRLPVTSATSRDVPFSPNSITPTSLKLPWLFAADMTSGKLHATCFHLTTGWLDVTQTELKMNERTVSFERGARKRRETKQKDCTGNEANSRRANTAGIRRNTAWDASDRRITRNDASDPTLTL